MGYHTTRNKKELNLPKCGAKNRQGKSCRNVAGKGTDHFGVGKCLYHGGLNPEVHGRWAVMRREQIKNRLAELQKQESSVLDLQEDVELMRALTLDYIDRYDEITEALIDWHRSYDEVFQDAARRFNAALNKGDSDEIGKRAEELERTWVFVRHRKPVKVKDLAEAVSLIEKCSRVVERIQKIRMMKALSLIEAQRLMNEMALVVTEVVDDDDKVQRIVSKWNNIRVKRAPKEIEAARV